MIPFQTHCNVNYDNWPWGDQNCTVKVSSWTFNKNEINLQPHLAEHNDYPESALTFDEFFNDQIEIFNSTTVVNDKTYPCCPGEIYTSMTMSVAFKQKAVFENNQLLRP